MGLVSLPYMRGGSTALLHHALPPREPTGDNMKYNPDSARSRSNLAFSIVEKLEACGFNAVTREKTNEAIYSREVREGISVLVYTSVVPTNGTIEVREVGADAIRVCAVYTNREGKERGIARADKRVHRVGVTEEIVDRMHQRMRDVWRVAQSPCTCEKCGAPKFKSKKGNEVCADLCFLSDEERNRPAPRRRQRRRYYGRRW